MNINFKKPGWAQRVITNASKRLPRLVIKKPEPTEITDEMVIRHAKAIIEGKE